MILPNLLLLKFPLVVLKEAQPLVPDLRPQSVAAAELQKPTLIIPEIYLDRKVMLSTTCKTWI